MYNNIGGKIKTVAIIGALLLSISFLITGIVFCSSGTAGLGILIIFGGALLSWVSSFVLYGFGQLIENTDIIASQFWEKQESNQENDIRETTNQEIVIQEKNKESIKILKDENVDSNTYVDIYCPICGEKISYTKAYIKSNRVLECPMCCNSFNTIDAFKR